MKDHTPTRDDFRAYQNPPPSGLVQQDDGEKPALAGSSSLTFCKKTT